MPGTEAEGGNNSLEKLNPKLKICGDNKFLYDLNCVTKVLGENIFDDKIKTGLLVIAGATGCGKNQIAFGLIWHYLRCISNWKRRPHLVTIEDPVEKVFFPLFGANAENSIPHDLNRRRGFDYTPRHLKLDVLSLKQALLDAKRMTPAVVFIGETRASEDWRDVIEFAGSGHLVVTTTHSGSLVETLQRIFKAIAADAPADRGNMAKSILAAVHTQVMTLGGGMNANVPALWVNSGTSAANLVADGLASLVPNNPGANGRKKAPKGCLGRYSLVQSIQEGYQGAKPA